MLQAEQQCSGAPRTSGAPARDWALAVALCAVAAIVGSLYARTFDATGARAAADLRSLPSRSMWYGQSDFGAAVALACGRGYHDPGPDLTPGLTAFLTLKADRFSCAELPASLPGRDLHITQRLYPYLLSATAAVWAVRGVSWSGLWPLFGLLYGATVAICFALFRLGMGRIAASAAALAIAVSPVHLGNLPGLRDYAKAPFILGLILIAVLLARSVPRTRALLAWSAAFGAVLGIGFGFRNDIVIVVPLFLIALVAWRPPRDARAIGTRMAAAAVAAATFVVVAFPILSGYSRGSNSGHVALMGLMTPFDRPLGIAGSLYEWGYAYSDGFGDTLIESYTDRVHGRAVEYLSPEYDRAMGEYLLRIARHWPADIVTRAYAAVLAIVDMPFAPGTDGDPVPYGIRSSALLRLYDWENAALSLMRGKGILIVALALLLLSRTGVWAALLVLVGLLYVAGYPAIQFQPRHFFHLEFISWWALGFLAHVAAGSAKERFRGARARGDWSPAARSVLLFACIALAIVLLPLAGLRWYQQRHLRAFLQTYADAPRGPVAARPVAVGDRTLLRADGLWPDRDPRHKVRAEYIVARLSPAACPVIRLPLTFRYATLDGQPDFSYDTIVTFLRRSRVDIFFPAYRVDDKFSFDGIEVSRGFEPCVDQIARVRDLAPLPMLVNLTLEAGWTQAPLYQRLAAWEVPDRMGAPALYTVPPTLTVPVRALDAPADEPAVLWATPMVHAGGGRAASRISGTPAAPEWPLVEFAAAPRTPDDRFVLEGEIVRGGVIVGLVRNHQWTDDGDVRIEGPGRFVAVLAPPAAGDYGVLYVNGLAGSWFLRYAPPALVRLAARVHDFNDVRITRAGWVRGD